jgi:hypothetical protein
MSGTSTAPAASTPRRTPVLPLTDTTRDNPRRVASGPATAPARGFQVLQSSRAPAQLCLFLRCGALDVK